MKSTNPKIYVACLKAYNNGRLHGEWIDADQDAANLQEAVTKMLHASPEHSEAEPCEEFAIHDYEGFEGYSVGEYTSLETIATLAKAMAEHGEAFAVYAADVGLEYALENFEEAYQGEHDSEQAFAEQLLDDTGELNEIPESLRYYFDYEKYARDLFISDYSYQSGYVFRQL